MLDSRQLRYFLAVAEELHFGKAAERLHMAQPPFSQQIAKLERELGVKLFIRTSRKVEMTREGEALFGKAGVIVDELERTDRLMADMGKGRAGTIRMGFVGPAMETGLPGHIRMFRQNFPRVRLELSELSTIDQLTAIRTKGLDIGYVRLYGHETEGLQARRIHREPYMLAVPSGHQLADRSRVNVYDLDGQDMIVAPRRIQPALYEAFFQVFDKTGIRPVIVQEAVRKDTTLALVGAGIGLALVPTASRKCARSDVHFVPISATPFPDVELYEVVAENHGFSAMRTYLEQSRQTLPDVE